MKAELEAPIAAGHFDLEYPKFILLLDTVDWATVGLRHAGTQSAEV